MELNSAIEALRDSKPKVYPKDKVGKWLIDLKADWINANTWRVLTERLAIIPDLECNEDLITYD